MRVGPHLCARRASVAVIVTLVPIFAALSRLAAGHWFLQGPVFLQGPGHAAQLCMAARAAARSAQERGAQSVRFG